METLRFEIRIINFNAQLTEPGSPFGTIDGTSHNRCCTVTLQSCDWQIINSRKNPSDTV